MAKGNANGGGYQNRLPVFTGMHRHTLPVFMP